MEILKRMLKDIVLPWIVILLFILAGSLTGCTAIETTRITITSARPALERISVSGTA